jgi:sterol desaturase/sphingolipid hydroxylase (fatty acid hydroxylase superfamily)
MSCIKEFRLSNYSFWTDIIAFLGIILLRYFLVAGGAYCLFYLIFNRSLNNRTPSLDSPSHQVIQSDIKLSILSAVVFAIAAALILSAYGEGMTRLYNESQPHQIWYFGISYIAVLILQDTYFYFTHRLFHHPTLFPWFHQGHHKSRYPTPWTSFAFDPTEAIAQSLFLVGIVFVIPLHLITLIAVLMTMTVWAVVNHLGLDRLPISFPHHWLGKWFIGPAHHSLHHLKYRVHYGLYFTFWDNYLGTQDPTYENQFSKATIDDIPKA